MRLGGLRGKMLHDQSTERDFRDVRVVAQDSSCLGEIGYAVRPLRNERWRSESGRNARVKMLSSGDCGVPEIMVDSEAMKRHN
jgi:hypothetical protein